MNKRLVTLMVAALALLSASGQVTFTNVGQYPVIEVTPENSTGLDKIYVVFDTNGVGMTFNSTTGQRATWESYYYSNGSLVMETVSGVRWDGMATTLDNVIPNIGYKIQEGNNHPFYCWVVNYADYMMSLNSISPLDESSCSVLSFNVDGYAPKIHYSSVNGYDQVLDREIKLSYNTLVWDDSTYWQETPVVETFESLEDGVSVTPPLCNTAVTLSGDRFLEEWGLTEPVGSYVYTEAVGCGTTAVKEERDNENEKSDDSEGLGGSAPIHIIFTGYPTDAVVYRVWEMATDEEFNDIILQYNQDEVDYTFNDAGTYYMRYRVANASGTCETYSETYTINVSESELECFNAFSPGSTEGVNDVWRVRYKSLVDFHCWIYNRWGTLVCEFTDPGDGWDGTYKGRLVDPGVYYYVIRATGSDGKKWSPRGDITILRYKRGAEGTSNGETTGY